MAGFGSFMEGLQGGVSSMQDIRRKRQLDELYDQEITLGREKVSGRDHSRARAGLPALKKFSSGDPFLFRLMEKLGRGTGTTESPTANALPSAGEFEQPLDETEFAAAADMAGSLDPEYGFADGTAGGLGDWLDDEQAGKPKRESYRADSKEEIARRAERARTGRPAGGATVEGDPSKYRPAKQGQVGNDMRRGAARAEAKAAQSAIPETPPKGRIASGVGKAGRFARGAGAGALAGGAIGAALENSLDGDAKLAEYYRRINRPGGEKDAGPWEAAGVRTIGVLQDVGRTFLPQAVEDRLFPYLGESEQAPGAIPTTAPASRRSPAGLPPGGRDRRPSDRRVASAPAAGPSQAIPEAAPAEANPLADFDVSKVSAEQIPNFSNKDWESFRDENIQELVANGMSYAEAWDKVDQQTIATQRRGFLHFASQADALLAGGDKKGAAAAVRAAFQYMPSTTDLKVGEYNGHVVAFGVDEETGEQIGTPIVVTPELLQQVQMNFANPQVWAQYAQDRRKLDQADTELEQGERRLGLMEEGLGIERENALTNRLAAIGGGSGGLNETNIATARRAIDDWAFGIGQSKDADPALGSALKALAEAEYKRRGGDLNTITLRLEEVLKASGEAAIIAAARRLASGQ